MSARSDDHSELQEQLREKTGLVEALTAQLEKTVNQLDRLRRSGADSPRFGPAEHPASPQADFVARLTATLDEWTDFQPADRIVRIEEGISQIIELLSTRSVAAEEGNSDVAPKAENNGFWEAAKAQLLSESPSTESPTPIQEPPAAESVSDRHAEAEQLETCPLAPDPPSTVSPGADESTLLEAVNSRDAYIQYLTSRVRGLETRRCPPIQWAELNNVPDELRQRLESLEASLHNQLKEAEIAHSLERAVLTRERARLAQVKQQLEAQIRRLNDRPQNPAEQEQNRQEEQESRWKRMFSR